MRGFFMAVDCATFQTLNNKEDNLVEYIYEYGLFFAKTLTFVAAFAIIVAMIAGASMKGKNKGGSLEIDDLSQKLKDLKLLSKKRSLQDERTVIVYVTDTQKANIQKLISELEEYIKN